jgi:uncharacterized protein
MKKHNKSAIMLASFLVFPAIVALPLIFYGVTLKTMDITLAAIYLISTHAIFLCLTLIAYNKELISYANDFKINGKMYIDKTIKYWYMGLFVMITSNLIINNFAPVDIPENEAAIRKALQLMPGFIIFSTTLFAPIIEEIICRQAIRDIIKNKWAFLSISSLFFGAAHIRMESIFDWNLLYIIPYGALGWAFALAFYKTNNLITPIFLHFLHNTILITLYLIVL